jgi:hypothetical protein
MAIANGLYDSRDSVCFDLDRAPSKGWALTLELVRLIKRAGPP